MLGQHICGRQEEPAIVISRMLLRMRCMCVVSICLVLRVLTFYHSLSNHVCFDSLRLSVWGKGEKIARREKEKGDRLSPFPFSLLAIFFTPFQNREPVHRLVF